MFLGVLDPAGPSLVPLKNKFGHTPRYRVGEAKKLID
jgi:hypothetical protein